MDATDRATWQDRLSKLSAYPTLMRNGKTVFRVTEVGVDWSFRLHRHPAHLPGKPDRPVVGPHPAPDRLQHGGRGGLLEQRQLHPYVLPGHARVGYDPGTILSNTGLLDSEQHLLSNLHIHSNGGGVEDLNTVPRNHQRYAPSVLPECDPGLSRLAVGDGREVREPRRVWRFPRGQPDEGERYRVRGHHEARTGARSSSRLSSRRSSSRCT